MSAAALIREFEAGGIRLSVNGDKLHVTAEAKAVTPDLKARLAEHKAAIMAELRTNEAVLLARCREACRGLLISPAALLAAMTEADKAAQLDGSEGPDVLRAFAECMAGQKRAELAPKIEAAYRWCRKELTERPGCRRATRVIDPDADPVLVAVAVRGAGCATLRIEKTRYQGRDFELLELIARADLPETDISLAHTEAGQ